MNGVKAGLALSLVLVLGSAGTGGAFHGPDEWTSSPTEGASPNTIQVSGTDCHYVSVPPTMTVRLLAQDGQTVIASQAYDPDPNGTWSGPFAIPAGLSPGTYPLRAECHSFGGPEDAGAEAAGFGSATVVMAQVLNDRSYTVVAPAEPPDPVEAEVSFTG